VPRQRGQGESLAASAGGCIGVGHTGGMQQDSLQKLQQLRMQDMYSSRCTCKHAKQLHTQQTTLTLVLALSPVSSPGG
jgi:hypothetical protein